MATDVSELGNSVLICMTNGELKNYNNFNDRTKKWLDLFLNRELDESDPVFTEVLKFYNKCIEKGMVNELLGQESTYVRMKHFEMQEKIRQGKEEIVLNLLDLEYDLDEIARITKFSIKQIEKIKSEYLQVN